MVRARRPVRTKKFVGPRVTSRISPLYRWGVAALARVVVTRGAKGATGWNAQGSVTIDPVRVQVVDTVGAGDTFQAALITWLAEHGALKAAALAALTSAQLKEALGFAARAAAITCSRRGADMPRRAEL